MNLFVVLLIIYLSVIFVSSVLRYSMSMVEGRIHETIARRLRQEIAKLIRRRKIGKTVAERGGTLVSVFTAEVDPLGEFAGQALSVPLIEGGIFFSVFIYMIVTEPNLAAIVIVLFIPQFAILPILQKRINIRSIERVRLLRASSEEGLRVLDDRPGSRFSMVTLAIRKVFALRMQIYRLKNLMKYGVQFFTFTSRVAVLGVGGYFVIHGETSLGVIVAFLTGLDRLNTRWNELVGFFRRVSDAWVKFGLIIDVIDAGRNN